MTTILIVDDSEVDRRLAGGLLDRAPDFTVAYAADGAEALQRMQRVLPDAVVTDLQMPGMDGLELVAAVRSEFPRVPVILITNHGSEETAIAALEWGAASYVPKEQLADRLLETVKQVLTLAGADRQYVELLSHLEQTEISLQLPSDPTLTGPLIDYIQLILASMKFGDATERVRVAIAVQEAVGNAMLRGNLELPTGESAASGDELRPTLADERRLQSPYKDRRVRVRVSIDREAARFEIVDEGRGFDTRRLSQLNDDGAAVSPARGLLLMQSFMDELHFNEAGNAVTMIKRRLGRSAKYAAGVRGEQTSPEEASTGDASTGEAPPAAGDDPNGASAASGPSAG